MGKDCKTKKAPPDYSGRAFFPDNPGYDLFRKREYGEHAAELGVSAQALVSADSA